MPGQSDFGGRVSRALALFASIRPFIFLVRWILPIIREIALQGALQPTLLA
jgi:hypothetical protein